MPGNARRQITAKAEEQFPVRIIVRVPATASVLATAPCRIGLMRTAGSTAGQLDRRAAQWSMTRWPFT